MAITPPGALGFQQLATAPTAPPAGFCVIYSKTDNVLYLKDSSGLEVALGTASGITGLTGDVTATGPGLATAVVAFVGGKTAAEIAASVNATDGATSVNFPLTLVKRDASGNFSAGIITANLAGLASGNVAKAGDTMSGDLNMGGNQIKNAAAPSLGGDLTNKTYVDTGLALKFDKTGGTLTGAVVITDNSPAALVVDGDVFVVDGTNNRVGINKLNPTEALDVIGNGKFTGTIVASNFNGTLTGTNTGDVSVTDTFSINLVLLGQALSANVRFADSTIDQVAGGVRVAPLSLTDGQIALTAAIAYSKLNLSNSIVNSDIAAAAAIAYAKLNLLNSITDTDIATTAGIVYSKLNLSNSIVNSDIAAAAAIAYSKLNLLLSIVDGDISPTAAIAYAKLNLSGSILNSDISAAAAILRSKLASGSAWRVLINNATGVMDEAAAITANRALISDTNGIPTQSVTTATELSYVNGVTSPIQAQINAINTSIITNEFYVDKSGNDTTGTGSILKPFLTIQRAANAIGTASSSADYDDLAKRFWAIRVMNGVYTENVTLGTRLVTVIEFNSAQLVGNVTINFDKGIAAGATTRQPKYIFKDADLRPSFTGSNIPLSGINGNINFNYINGGSAVTCQIHLIHTGVSGNITTALGPGGTNNGTLQLYGSEAYLTGQFQIITNTGAGAVFLDSMGDDTVGLGGVTGNCTLQMLRNVRFSGVVNVARNQTGAQWYNVSFFTGSSLSGSSGSISVDANSYQSYFTNVTTKGTETFNFIDNARAVAYNPTTPADWATTPSTVMAGLDSAAARLATHAARHNPGGADALATASAVGLDANSTNTEGAAASFARSNHTHDLATGVVVTQVPDQANAEGVSPNLARADHIHNIPSGPVVQVGTSNFPGASASFALSDHVHAHGNQTSGTLHAVVTALVNGFMSTLDKIKLDAATALNTFSTLVFRDAAGKFAATEITSDLVGNVTGNVSGSAGSFTGNLVGDVTGTQGATVVAQVGGKTAAQVSTFVDDTLAASSANTPSTIVKRSAAGLTELTTQQLNGTTSGSVQLKAADTTTSYAIKLPATQGAPGTYPTNDGAGNLTWSSPQINIDGGRSDSVFIVGANIVGGTP